MNTEERKVNRKINRKLYNGKAYPVVSFPISSTEYIVLKNINHVLLRCKEYGLPIEIQYWVSLDNNHKTKGFMKLKIYSNFKSYKSWCKNEYNINVTLDDFKKMKKYCEDFRILEVKDYNEFDKRCLEICGKYYV